MYLNALSRITLSFLPLKMFSYHVDFPSCNRYNLPNSSAYTLLRVFAQNLPIRDIASQQPHYFLNRRAHYRAATKEDFERYYAIGITASCAFNILQYPSSKFGSSN